MMIYPVFKGVIWATSWHLARGLATSWRSTRAENFSPLAADKLHCILFK